MRSLAGNYNRLHLVDALPLQITQEYGRRLIFELQQQEKILQTQFQQQNTHAQLREANDANWRLQQKAKELQQKLDATEHKQKAAEDEAQLLQREAEVRF